MSTPLASFLDAFGVMLDGQLAGGHQSQMHTGHYAGRQVVVKVMDGRRRDRTTALRRAALVVRLAAIDGRVVAPLEVDGRRVLDHGDDLITVLPRVDGQSPDRNDAHDTAWLGRTLAELHGAMRELPADLPPVAALRVPAAPRPTGSWQLLHGDASPDNVLRSSNGGYVLDLDDCGVGPPTFDVAQTLFMDLFGVTLAGRPHDHASFRRDLVRGYETAAGASLDATELDGLVEHRRGALRHWVDNPEEAPDGIRASTPEWRQVLRGFVGATTGR